MGPPPMDWLTERHVCKHYLPAKNIIINHPSHTQVLSFVKHFVAEALDTRDPPIICKTLKVMMTLANLDVDDGTGRMIKAGAALVPYYRQLLPVLNMFKMKNGKYLKTKPFYSCFDNRLFLWWVSPGRKLHYRQTRKFPHQIQNTMCPDSTQIMYEPLILQDIN